MKNENEKNRVKFGILSGIIGVVTNTILCAFKIVVGILSGIISITADGINNLSDMGSSAISLFGYKFSNKPADEKHPFGHARIEYILSLIIGISVISIGINLISGSIGKIIEHAPAVTTYSTMAMIILGVSIFVKVSLAFIYYSFFVKTKSLPLKAVAIDSLSDILGTAAILIALLISRFTGINLDGYVGILASLIIIISGIKIILESLSPLLGERPRKELINTIITEIKSNKAVLGIHDLTIHNYGPNRNFASAHVEVDARIDIMISHDMIDNIERKLKEQNIFLVIHLDPVVVGDAHTDLVKAAAAQILNDIDTNLTLHDFRMVVGTTHSNLIFDIVAPTELSMSDSELITLVQEKIQQYNPTYFAVIQVDHNYIS